MCVSCLLFLLLLLLSGLDSCLTAKKLCSSPSGDKHRTRWYLRLSCTAREPIWTCNLKQNNKKKRQKQLVTHHQTKKKITARKLLLGMGMLYARLPCPHRTAEHRFYLTAPKQSLWLLNVSVHPAFYAYMFAKLDVSTVWNLIGERLYL